MQYLAVAYQVVALTMILIQQGCYEQLIDCNVFRHALGQIKLGRCCDSIGMAAEGFKHISNDTKDYLINMFNNRANLTNVGGIMTTDIGNTSLCG